MTTTAVRPRRPGPTDYVWYGSGYPATVVVHDRISRNVDRTVTVDVRGTPTTGPVAGWAYTRCGILTYRLKWDADAGRFYIGDGRGHDAPLRLLNPAHARLCRKCWP